MRSARALSDRRRALALSLVVIVSACGSGSGEEGSPAPEGPSAEPVHAPAVETATPEPTEVGAEAATAAEPRAPADACARAQSCCPAYVSALPPSGRGEAGEACTSLALAVQLEGQARDEACQGAIEGFRASLQATGLDVPAACR